MRQVPTIPLLKIGSNSPIHTCEEHCSLVPGYIMSTFLRTAHFSTNSLFSHIWALGPRTSLLSLRFFFPNSKWLKWHGSRVTRNGVLVSGECTTTRRIMVCALHSESDSELWHLSCYIWELCPLQPLIAYMEWSLGLPMPRLTWVPLGK